MRPDSSGPVCVGDRVPHEHEPRRRLRRFGRVRLAASPSRLRPSTASGARASVTCCVTGAHDTGGRMPRTHHRHDRREPLDLAARPRPCSSPNPPTRSTRSRRARAAASRTDATRSPPCAPAGRASSTRGRSSARSRATTSRRTRTSASAITAASTVCGSRAGAAPATCAGSTRPIAASCAALDGLRASAEAIGETDEAQRCAEFLYQLDPGLARRPTRVALPAVKRALITGITGQDGRHLSEFLDRPRATRSSASSAARPTRRSRWSRPRTRRSSSSRATCATCRR